jgi:hypothetical protein
MRLGLGLGLQDQALGEPPADWTNWDNSLSGSVTQYVTGGNQGASGCAGITSTKALLYTNDGDDGTDPNQGKVAYLTRSGETGTLGSFVDVTNSNPAWPQVHRLSSTRAVCIAEDGDSNIIKINLIDVSGASPSELDEHTVTGITTPNFHYDFSVLTATKGILVMRDTAGTDTVKMVIIEFTSDTISQGTVVDGTIDSDAPNNATCVIALTSTSFMWAYDDNFGYATISGTTITIQDTAQLSFVGTGQYDKSIQRVDDTHAVLFAEYPTDNAIYAVVLTWNGVDTVSAGSEVSVIPSVGFGGAPSNWSTQIGDGLYILTIDDGGRTPTSAIGVVVTVNTGTYAISADTEIQISGDIEADHNCVTAFPDTGYKYLFWLCQDETNTPVKQIQGRILKA